MSKIVFIGAERVGKACIQRLIDLKKDICAIFTADESLKEKIADFVSFDDIALKYGIPLLKITNSKDSFLIEKINSFRPDLIVVISWFQILPKKVIQAAPRGCVHIHYSLLPKRRGGAPLFWAIFDGLEESGITLHYVDERIDSGDIIDQAIFKILPLDTCKTLLDKILILAPELLAKNIDEIESGKAMRYKQIESEATYTKLREPSESIINWKMNDEQICRFVRALAPPYPSAYTIVGNRRIVFTNAEFINGKLHLHCHLE